jgi:hypothetical protein
MFYFSSMHHIPSP